MHPTDCSRQNNMTIRFPFLINLPRCKPSLSSAIRGRELNALLLEDDNQTLRLRFSDNSMALVNLNTREFEIVSARKYKEWLTLPGWVRIANVMEDDNQIILVVSGAIYMSRISFRFSHQRWQIFFSGGRLL